jgi:hypothetical protein
MLLTHMALPLVQEERQAATDADQTSCGNRDRAGGGEGEIQSPHIHLVWFMSGLMAILRFGL